MNLLPCPEGPWPDGTTDLNMAEMEAVNGGRGVPLPPMTYQPTKIIVDDGAPI